MQKSFILVLFVISSLLCEAQRIPAVSNPTPVYNHPKRSLIPNSELPKHQYVWWIIYPDHLIAEVRKQGYNIPKEVGPLTEQECLGAVQDCKQEGLIVRYERRLNPSYNPNLNKGYQKPEENSAKPAYESPYDPLEDAVSRSQQTEKKVTNSDPNVVDLSDLKDPYSAKVDPYQLKKPLSDSSRKTVSSSNGEKKALSGTVPPIPSSSITDNKIEEGKPNWFGVSLDIAELATNLYLDSKPAQTLYNGVKMSEASVSILISLNKNLYTELYNCYQNQCTSTTEIWTNTLKATGEDFLGDKIFGTMKEKAVDLGIKPIQKITKMPDLNAEKLVGDYDNVKSAADIGINIGTILSNH